MNNIKLLDCTLRDGGSLNNWDFTKDTVINILQNLNNANIDVIEAGFLQNPRFIQEYYDELFSTIKNKRIQTALMIDFGHFDIDSIKNKDNSLTDGIRIMFKKSQMDDAILSAKKLSDKGYKISLNPVSTTTYEKSDILKLAKYANSFNPDVVYIIDTYGLMNNSDVLKYLNYYNEYLNDSIKIGFHAHNNMQMAFSNSIEIINNTQRPIVIDGSLYGMGKRAGNTPIELLSVYLNNHYHKNYNINKITSLIENEIIPLQQKFQWGYNLIHYTAAINKCHSDYVTYLKEEKLLSIEEINNLLPFIEETKKLNFDLTHIEEIYRSRYYASK